MPRRIVSLMPLVIAFAVFGASCTVSKTYRPHRKLDSTALKRDFSLLQDILEKKHPSLYWYTPRDRMEHYFAESQTRVTDSMSAHDFGWQIVAPLLAKIHCGHTSLVVKRPARDLKKINEALFPLFLKVWKDSLMVVANLNEDTILKPGTFITAINGLGSRTVIDSMFTYLPEDGYSNNFKYIRLSASFPYLHKNIFGAWPFYNIGYVDSMGIPGQTLISWWLPKADSTAESSRRSPPLKRAEKRLRIRSLVIDSTFAVMDLNAFSRGNLRPFFRRSFRALRKKEIPHLVVDLRINGGGDINKAVMLTRYIRDEKFKVADSAYSISKNFNPFSGHISKSFWNNIALLFASRKRADGKYHFGYWERKFFKPKKRNHFAGDVYVLTNGLTFSAASLFCSLVKGQPNVTLVGEETGGGWYGNSGILIPDIILPETGLRVRLPFFRLVQYQHDDATKGLGVPPDWYIGPNAQDILQGRDTKLEAVIQKIKGEKR